MLLNNSDLTHMWNPNHQFGNVFFLRNNLCYCNTILWSYTHNFHEFELLGKRVHRLIQRGPHWEAMKMLLYRLQSGRWAIKVCWSFDTFWPLWAQTFRDHILSLSFWQGTWVLIFGIWTVGCTSCKSWLPTRGWKQFCFSSAVFLACEPFQNIWESPEHLCLVCTSASVLSKLKKQTSVWVTICVPLSDS